MNTAKSQSLQVIGTMTFKGHFQAYATKHIANVGNVHSQ